MAWTLWVAAGVQAFAALAFLRVSRTLQVHRRPYAPVAPARAFVVWWSGLGIYLGIESILDILGALGMASLPVVLAAQYLSIPLICAGAWGLTFYVAYLFTGWGRLAVVLAAYMGLVALAWIALVVASPDAAVFVDAWQVDLVSMHPDLFVVNILIGVPALAATLFYLSLLRRVETRLQRYRVALVGSSILAWVALGMVTTLAASRLWVAVTITGLGLITAGAVHLAYHPPRRVEAWLDDPQSRSS